MGRRSHLDRRVVEGQPCECGLRALRLAEKARERRREEREEVQYSLPFGSEYFTSSLDHKEGWATYRATGAVWFDEPGHDCRRQDGAGKTFLIHPQVGVYRMEGGQIVRLVNLFVYPPHHQSIVTAINRDEKVVTRRLGRNGEVLEEFEGVRVDLFGLEEVKA